MELFNDVPSAIRFAESPLFEFSVIGTKGVKIHREALSDRFPELSELFQMDQTDEDFEMVADSFGFDTKSGQFSWGTHCFDTFGLFIQFVYTGKYTVSQQGKIAPKARKCVGCGNITVAPCPFHSDTTHGQLVSMREKTRTYLLKKYGHFFPQFYDQTSHQIVSPSPDNEAWDDYASVFETHLKVFLFAEKRHLETLWRFATYKVQQLLLGLICYDETVDQVVQFLGNFLRHTGEGAECDDMVATVVHFAACYANRFWANLQFVELIGSNRLLCYMFIDAVVNGAPKIVEEQPCE